MAARLWVGAPRARSEIGPNRETAPLQRRGGFVFGPHLPPSASFGRNCNSVPNGARRGLRRRLGGLRPTVRRGGLAHRADLGRPLRVAAGQDALPGASFAARAPLGAAGARLCRRAVVCLLLAGASHGPVRLLSRHLLPPNPLLTLPVVIFSMEGDLDEQFMCPPYRICEPDRMLSHPRRWEEQWPTCSCGIDEPLRSAADEAQGAPANVSLHGWHAPVYAMSCGLCDHMRARLGRAPYTGGPIPSQVRRASSAGTSRGCAQAGC